MPVIRGVKPTITIAGSNVPVAPSVPKTVFHKSSAPDLLKPLEYLVGKLAAALGADIYIAGLGDMNRPEEVGFKLHVRVLAAAETSEADAAALVDRLFVAVYGIETTLKEEHGLEVRLTFSLKFIADLLSVEQQSLLRLRGVPIA